MYVTSFSLCRRFNTQIGVDDVTKLKRVAVPTAILKPGEKPEVLYDYKHSDWVQPLFFFAIVWTIGASTDEEGRRKLDAFLRDLCFTSGLSLKAERRNGRQTMCDFRLVSLLPRFGSVYDYAYFDASKSRCVYAHVHVRVQGLRMGGRGGGMCLCHVCLCVCVDAHACAFVCACACACARAERICLKFVRVHASALKEEHVFSV